MKRYVILINSSTIDLQARVNAKLAEGWQLCGALVTYKDSLTRYFIREMMLPEGVVTYEAQNYQEHSNTV